MSRSWLPVIKEQLFVDDDTGAVLGCVRRNSAQNNWQALINQKESLFTDDLSVISVHTFQADAMQAVDEHLMDNNH